MHHHRAPPTGLITSLNARNPRNAAYGDGGGAALVSSTSDYVYANFTSKKFGFVDDVEFLFSASPPPRSEVPRG